ncbi:LamG domain-containing protein [Paenibacillus sp. LMG 31461]|uniref:LamG domain-containing protein n=1 Tax=Paenibacillus plantarum TaxID=2654975 RepID=A0ABX1XN87_9BACL|nr:LamG domain-containing protein [Paenibacillus plantarum]NOU69421.1 LamG domain-containing protein [Paenibacillus plantarum]
MSSQQTNVILAQPSLVAFWDFQEGAGEKRIAKGPNAYVLQEGARLVHREEDGIFGPYAARLNFGDWFMTPREMCPELNFHGSRSNLTILAWIKREKNDYQHCQAIAGMWDETDSKRQYALFLNLRIWDSYEQVGGHVSAGGGPTEGYTYCMTSSLGATEVNREEWHVVGFTYNGKEAISYLDGKLDQRETYNPFYYGEELYDGGQNGSDFTVGAVHRSEEIGNFYTGLLGGLAVFNRALTQEEIAILSHR